jgi:uncharacterized lipoprotein NlpE involved in copper resistance
LKPIGLVAIVLSLSGCQYLGLQTADTFNQKLAYSYGQVTAARKGATAVVNASCQTPETAACKQAVADGKHVQAMADQAREGLDLAKTYAAAGNLQQANIQLQLESAALTALSAYLTAKGVQ